MGFQSVPDQPGWGPPFGLKATETAKLIGRLNAKEFVRLDFVPFSATGTMLDWDNNERGTRCSDKVYWCTAVNILADLDKKIDNGAFYKFKKRERFDNNNGDPEAGDPLPSLKIYKYGTLLNFKPDNDIYFEYHWDDSVIDEVDGYDFTRENGS